MGRHILPTIRAGSYLSFNKNRISANSAATTVFSAPTVTVLGTQVNFDYIPTSFKTGGVTDKFTYEDHIVLAPNMNYLFRLTNDSSSAIDIHQHIVFFESTSGLV